MSEESSQRYLTFDLDGRCFAVEVERVEVVLEAVPITRVPRAPGHLRGVINYRGSVIPVADLRARFADGERSDAAASSIIVLNVRYSGEDMTIGVLADSVREVVALEASAIERSPRMGSSDQDALLEGIANRGGEFIIVLDIDEAFKAEAGERGSEAR